MNLGVFFSPEIKDKHISRKLKQALIKRKSAQYFGYDTVECTNNYFSIIFIYLLFGESIIGLDLELWSLDLYFYDSKRQKIMTFQFIT